MMNNDIDYITVNKVLFKGGGLVCLQAYENDQSLYMPLSAIKRITLYDQYSHKETLLTTNITLTDMTVSSFGTIWAIDVLGHLYRAGSGGLNGTNLDENLEIHTYGAKWSLQGITKQTPVCIIGENDDLWIATQEGGLIHYDGQNFTAHSGIKLPIRFKRVNGHYFLMGYDRQLMQYVDGKWHTLKFDESIAADIPINDVTYVHGHLLAVSNLGFILYQQADNLFFTLLDTKAIPWFGCDTFQDTVYLAAGQGGAYKLSLDARNALNTDKPSIASCDLISIKKGHFVAVTVLDYKVVFLQALTKTANFVCHSPFDQKRWFLVKT
ncbi:hypothetical protein [Psychrobacter sp. I-STPA10]|uniref:hypothetical protein n=1 Tax=Psychrobacter sp. I-STPA10 TaxID=2585769 RepID=UPI001E5BD92F|nr:hypothetical protein [Psychrobacter sp. I-STPA10]